LDQPAIERYTPRANLTPGPETRYYVGQFLVRDTLVGQLKDVLVVTIPGVA